MFRGSAPFILRWASVFPCTSYSHGISVCCVRRALTVCSANSSENNYCKPTDDFGPASICFPQWSIYWYWYTYWRYCLWMHNTNNERGKTYIVRLHCLKTVAFAWICSTTVHQHMHHPLSGSGPSVVQSFYDSYGGGTGTKLLEKVLLMKLVLQYVSNHEPKVY